MTELYYQSTTITKTSDAAKLETLADLTLSFVWLVHAELLAVEKDSAVLSPYAAIAEQIDQLPAEVQAATIEAFELLLDGLKARNEV
jgi:hypothetical protein